MPGTIERRRTTRTIRGADEIKNNLSQVAAEIGRARDQARQEVESLEKIRGMLDTGYLENLLASIEELENRIEDLEQTTLDSRNEVDRHQEELTREQDRLKKLWDAYKSQEDEIERLRRDYPLMEEKLFERERTIETLKREIARLEPMEGYKGDYDDLEKQHQGLEDEVTRLENTLHRSKDRVDFLEREVETLRENQADLGRVAELERNLDEERERLAKLYKVYEDLEAEKNEASLRNEDWEQWHRTMAPHMRAAGKSFEDAPE
jgi:chromosome segregation ATPase